MSENFKKKFIFYAKIIVSITIMYFVFRKIDLRNLIQNIAGIPIWLVLVLLFTTAIKIYFQYKNWEKYLKLNPEYIPKKNEIGKSFFIGEALRFVVPGGYGTIGKMYFVNNKKSATFISVGVEKFLQIWTSLAFVSLASIFYFQHIHILIKIGYSIAVLAIPFLIHPISILLKKPAIFNYSKEYNKVISPIIFRQFLHMLLTFFQYFVIISHFQVISFFDVCISVPLILSANLIPITFSGLGLRETFAVEVLNNYGIGAEIAITCSLLIFFVNNVLSALLGAYFIFAHKKL